MVHLRLLKRHQSTAAKPPIRCQARSLLTSTAASLSRPPPPPPPTHRTRRHWPSGHYSATAEVKISFPGRPRLAPGHSELGSMLIAMLWRHLHVRCIPVRVSDDKNAAAQGSTKESDQPTQTVQFTEHCISAFQQPATTSGATTTRTPQLTAARTSICKPQQAQPPTRDLSRGPAVVSAKPVRPQQGRVVRDTCVAHKSTEACNTKPSTPTAIGHSTACESTATEKVSWPRASQRFQMS